jgi:ABC-type transport system involved in multi-copper enzyme maturation permease subunit
MTADVLPVPRDPGVLRTFVATVSAVLSKELRWRMRGRRAFVVLTVYTLSLSLLVFGLYQLMYATAVSESRWVIGDPMGDSGEVAGFMSTEASVKTGQVLYGGLLGLLTMLTLLLAPALASGAISTEREKQTLELLVTTPISTLGMVVAKLFASLAYVYLLLIASVPLMSVVFLFGGVAPEDVLRAYLWLSILAFGVGAIGMAMSALVGRTQIAVVVSYVLVLLLTVGSLAVHTYLWITSVPPDVQSEEDRRHAPEPLLWLNPIAADIDLVCTALPDPGRVFCGYVDTITGRQAEDMFAAGWVPPRDAFWPKAAVAWLVVGGAMVLLTTQAVAPTRRIRARRPVSRDVPQPG